MPKLTMTAGVVDQESKQKSLCAILQMFFSRSGNNCLEAWLACSLSVFYMKLFGKKIMGYLDRWASSCSGCSHLAETKANVNCRNYRKIKVAAFVLNVTKMSGGETFKLAMRLMRL